MAIGPHEGSTGSITGDAPNIPEHHLLRRIGEGAYGEVWLARNIMGVLRAVKIVYRRRFSDERPYEREFNGITKFEPLSRSAEGLVDILQVGRDDAAGFFYYIMELADDGGGSSNETGNPKFDKSCSTAGVEGSGFRLPSNFGSASRDDSQFYCPKSLGSEIRKRGRLPFEECVQLGLSLSLALGRLHRQGLLHRDVKPSNIIFVGGVPKLADIGLVTDVAEARSYVGTEGFIPPDGPNSPQADLYALGKVLYEISMGKDRQEFPEPRTALIEDPDAPALLELNAVILKACALNPRERYQSAEDMHADLALLHSGRSVKRKHVLERRVAWMSKAGPVVAAAALLATGAFVLQRRQTVEIKRLAKSEAFERQRAQSALSLADENLIRLQIKRAEDDFASERAAQGLAELAAVLRQHPTNHVAAERLWSALSQRTFLLPQAPAISVAANISAARFSPDGRFLFVACEDGTGQFRDTRNGQPASGTLSSGSAVIEAAFSQKDDELITVSRDGMVHFFRVPSGESTRAPLRLNQTVSVAAFSSDGEWLSVSDTNQPVRVWNLLAGQRSCEVSSDVEASLLELNGEKGLMVLAGRGPDTPGWSARVYDARTGNAVTPSLRHSSRISSLCFSPNGERVVTGSEDATAQLWDTGTGERLGHPVRHENWVNSVDFAPEGARIATASADRTVRICDAATGEQLCPPLQHSAQVVFVQFSPDGRRILTVTLNNTVHLWDALEGKPLCEPILIANTLRIARFSSDGDTLLLVSDDRKARLFDLRLRQSLSRTFYAPSYIRWVAFSPNGKYLAAADRADSGWVWNLSSNSASAVPLRHARPLNEIEFSPNGDRIVTASEDMTARIWDAFSGKAITPPLKHGGSVMSAVFDNHGDRIVTTSVDHTARIWNARSGEAIGPPLKHEGEVYYAEFSPDGERIVTASADGTARLWQIGESAKLLGTVRHQSAVFGAHFSRDGHVFVTWSEDRTARLWNAQSCAPLSAPLKHNNEVVSAALSPDGSRLVTGSHDGTARIWDGRTGRALSEPLQHDDTVELARFSEDGQRIVTASRDGTARIWDGFTGQPVSEPLRHSSRVWCALFSPDGKWIVSSSRDLTARIWEAPPRTGSIPSWLPALAEAVGTRKLDPQRVLVPVDDSEYWRLRDQLANSQSSDPYAMCAKWFFADRAQRGLSPASSVTFAELEEESQRGDAQSQADQHRIDDWIRLAPADPVALMRAAQRTATTNSVLSARNRALADWWSYQSIKRVPDSPELWQMRAAVLHQLGDTTRAVSAIQKAMDLDARPVFAFTKARWLEAEGRIAAAAEACDSEITALKSCRDPSVEWHDRLRLQRINLWRQLGREEDARAELMDLKHFLPRAADTPSNLLDLTACYNARPDENWHCHTDRGNNLANLPLGVRDFGGVAFDVRGIIQIAGGKIAIEPDYLDSVTGIKVRRVCRRLHFLHGTGWIAAEDTTIGSWVLHLSDGSTESIPIVYGKDVRNWQFWPGMPPEKGGAEPVWKGTQERWKNWTGAGVRLYKTTWENPHPEAPITSIDFVSAKAGSAPFLLAITVE